jgi:hypothetical protein
MTGKLQLNFRVDPVQLEQYTEVPDPVKLRIVNTGSPVVRKYLGESGLRLANHDFNFYFTRSIAIELISRGDAIELS